MSLPYSPKYPHNWPRASRTLRRVVGRCERCQSSEHLTVHHVGVPFAAGRPNHPANKHDLRRENLQVLCVRCHRRREFATLRKQGYKRRAYLLKKAVHDRLGVGSGLVRCEVRA